MSPKIINNKNFFSLIIISTPFLSYSNANLISFNLLFASSVLLLLLGTIIIIFLLGRLLSLFIKKIDYKVFFLGLSFFFFTLFYSFPFFKNLLYKITPIYSAEISLFISLIFLFLILFFFFSEKKNFIKYFILIFIYACFIADAGILIVNNLIFLS